MVRRVPVGLFAYSAFWPLLAWPLPKARSTRLPSSKWPRSTFDGVCRVWSVSGRQGKNYGFWRNRKFYKRIIDGLIYALEYKKSILSGLLDGKEDIK